MREGSGYNREGELFGLLRCTAPTESSIQYCVTGSAPCMRIMFGQAKERKGTDGFVPKIWVCDAANKRRGPGNILRARFFLAFAAMCQTDKYRGITIRAWV